VLSNNRTVAGFTVWLESPQRRQYDKVVFDQNNSYPRHFNQWK
jgi:hypothetical protein